MRIFEKQRTNKKNKNELTFPLANEPAGPWRNGQKSQRKIMQTTAISLVIAQRQESVAVHFELLIRLLNYYYYHHHRDFFLFAARALKKERPDFHPYR
jgi:hypothetical protein